MDGRVIKFRGKRLDNGEWVYGYYIYRLGHHVIYTNEGEPLHKVDSKTVGQFTGLLDRNKTRIFEGDIVISNPKKYLDEPTAVEWSDDPTWDSDGTFTMWSGYWHSHAMPKDIEVIGNIYSNPELVGKKAA